MAEKAGSNLTSSIRSVKDLLSLDNLRIREDLNLITYIKSGGFFF